MLAPYFSDPIDILEIDEEAEQFSEKEKKKFEVEKEKKMAYEKLQAEALEKQKTRNDVMGELLRSKGFLWIATSNDLIGGWQQAGNVVRIRSEGQWMCLTPQFWEGTSSESLVRQVKMSLMMTLSSQMNAKYFFLSQISKY